MSNPLFSKGPWKRIDIVQKVEGANVAEHWVLSDDGDELACCDNPDDANVIAAAPQLYHALKWLLSVVPNLEGEISILGMNLCNEAIMKANGDHQ